MVCPSRKGSSGGGSRCDWPPGEPLVPVPVWSCCQGLVPGLWLLITCNPKSLKNPPPRLLFLALAGPFCVLGNLEKPEIRIEQRAEGMGFEGYWGPSSAYWTVDAVRGVDAHVYLRWVLGQRQFNAAPHQKTIVTSTRGARLGV